VLSVIFQQIDATAARTWTGVGSVTVARGRPIRSLQKQIIQGDLGRRGNDQIPSWLVAHSVVTYDTMVKVYPMDLGLDIDPRTIVVFGETVL